MAHNHTQSTIRTIIIAGILMLACVSNTWANDAASAHIKSQHPWPALVEQAEARGLPTEFLKEIDPTFVTVVFEDLRTYAAEYHPEDHRMILNMRLSFNKAGGVLANLNRMTHHDLGLLYHELFHAYLDYLFSAKDPQTLSPTAQQILALANKQLQCHYRFVRINPIRQRKAATELRFLSKEDAWEVLNETWAVFVGWAVWTQLEIFKGNLETASWNAETVNEWKQRLTQATQSGELLGYYEPDDPQERRVARKRFIAPSNGMTPKEVELILTDILHLPPEVVQASTGVIEQARASTEPPPSCD
ncbi:MAG: hypothetical protein MRJ96_06985 [Nitrospirales bacterium]|nr:hypothetical protein [Nitrospira sp.]MDR4501177.1 hypothetical protein [Nitrospirales bacterium]